MRLRCDRDELETRVTNKKRKPLGKIATKRLLSDVSSRSDPDSEIPFQPSLTINTTSQSPRKAAMAIAQALRSPNIEGTGGQNCDPLS